MPQVTLKLRRATESQWIALNPILEDGEPGVAVDIGRFKLGNGVDPWNDLPYTSIKGDKGDPGPVGPPGSVVYQHKGEWSNVELYDAGNIVLYNGSTYICSRSNTGLVPDAPKRVIRLGGPSPSIIPNTTVTNVNQYQPFTVNETRHVTYVSLKRASSNSVNQILNSDGVVLGTFTVVYSVDGSETTFPLSNSVLLEKDELYYLYVKQPYYWRPSGGITPFTGIINTYTSYSNAGTINGTPTGGYVWFNLFGDNPESWVTLASKGDKGDKGNLNWKNAWIATSYYKDDVVTHDGSTWMAITDTTDTQIPGGSPVPVLAGESALGPIDSVAVISYGGTLVDRWQAFCVSSETLLTHISLESSSGQQCTLRDNNGAILATFISNGLNTPSSLSAPVLLQPNQTYWLSEYTAKFYTYPAAVPDVNVIGSGIISELQETAEGIWDSKEIKNPRRLIKFKLYHSPETPWAQLAAKGDPGVPNVIFGSKQTATSELDTTGYLPVEINGVTYKLALIT